jgi:hypothetical protein
MRSDRVDISDLSCLPFNLVVMEKEQLIKKWIELSSDEKEIMGKPNFTLGKIAHRMREMGFEIPRQAEWEQALVIWTMLEFHKEFKEEWGNQMSEFLKKG